MTPPKATWAAFFIVVWRAYSVSLGDSDAQGNALELKVFLVVVLKEGLSFVKSS
jgi:hypothetical protein